jgi:quercetin dioxygenase-like cupin family protein
MITITSPPRSASAEPLWFLHNLAFVHVSGAITGDRFSLVEIHGEPGDMPPLHVHDDEDETFFVLEGSLELHIAGRDPVVVQPGEAAFAPRGVAHVYRVISSTPARWLVALPGSGFAAFVCEVSVPAPSPVLPPSADLDPVQIAACAARHGIEILAPPGTLP